MSEQTKGWAAYRPLIVIIALTALSAFAKGHHYGAAAHFGEWMADFMGFFLVVFAMFKLFDLGGFAHGFAMYDLLAKRCQPYALVYPFLELGLGLAYLARWQPLATNLAALVLFSFGAAGVLLALKRGLDVNCACLGTTLKVPLSTVALTEDIGMALMAAAMLLLHA
jgi:hypothetical protein